MKKNILMSSQRTLLRKSFILAVLYCTSSIGFSQQPLYNTPESCTNVHLLSYNYDNTPGSFGAPDYFLWGAVDGRDALCYLDLETYAINSLFVYLSTENCSTTKTIHYCGTVNVNGWARPPQDSPGLLDMELETTLHLLVLDQGATFKYYYHGCECGNT